MVVKVHDILRFGSWSADPYLSLIVTADYSFRYLVIGKLSNFRGQNNLLQSLARTQILNKQLPLGLEHIIQTLYPVSWYLNMVFVVQQWKFWSQESKLGAIVIPQNAVKTIKAHPFSALPPCQLPWLCLGMQDDLSDSSPFVNVWIQKVWAPEWLKRVPAVSHIWPSSFLAYFLCSLVPTSRWCSKHCIMWLPLLPFDKIKDFKCMNFIYELLIGLNQKHNLSFTPHPHAKETGCLQRLSFPFCLFFSLFTILYIDRYDIMQIKLFCWRENFYKSKMHFFS